MNPVCGYDSDETRLDSVNLADKQGIITETSIAKLPSREYAVRASGNYIGTMPLPFGRSLFFVYKGGVLYTGWNNAIEVSVISENGEVLRTIEREYGASSVTQGEIQNLIAHRASRDRREILQSDLLPDTKPAYDALAVDDDGQVWIGKYPDSEFASWLLLDSDSKLIGRWSCLRTCF